MVEFDRARRKALEGQTQRILARPDDLLAR
jgi:hypothetical protein